MSQSNIARRRALAQQEGNAAYLEKRAQVVSAATVLFKEKGFDATTLGDIAEAVSMDRASLYYYFPSKNEILQESVAGVTGRNLEMVRGLGSSDLSPSERIRNLIHNALVSFHENYPQVFVYIQEDMTRISDRDDPWAQTMLKQTREFEEALLDLIRDGVTQGAFRPDLNPVLVAHAMWGMINWTHRWYRPGQFEPAEIAEEFATVFLRGVERRPEDGAGPQEAERADAPTDTGEHDAPPD
ncbi:TetR family transcriptional regulator [Nocardioides sp. Y6]|uniref:TetR family transcriptional regulator n=1 Tax=Nocardioides malaquae TaxID=2773426 RepID=A0ABR9RT34_9ACTN|nr:TetR/AcrR family transcriptional regulator [Nocardioides malaquae]MBE7324757.1 TetR family transcriptional regulator [Nocardioides malaquae]